jgi:hypothetical protein
MPAGTLLASSDCEAYPYGETRFTSGTIYTDKLFTGWVDWRSRVETGQREMRRPDWPTGRVEGAGCSAEGYEFWLAEMLTRLLLPSTKTDRCSECRSVSALVHSLFFYFTKFLNTVWRMPPLR